MDYIKIRDKVRNMIKPSRYVHSLGVVSAAEYLARRFGVDETSAVISGIYHDAYRYSAKKEDIAILLESGFTLDAAEINEPMLLHGPLAALYFERDTGESIPEDMKKAVRHHTLGSKDMTRLGAIIYISDYTEPGRKHLSDEDRAHIFSLGTLEEMVCFIIEMQRPYFERNDIKEAKVTSELYSFIKDGGRL